MAGFRACQRRGAPRGERLARLFVSNARAETAQKSAATKAHRRSRRRPRRDSSWILATRADRDLVSKIAKLEASLRSVFPRPEA